MLRRVPPLSSERPGFSTRSVIKIRIVTSNFQGCYEDKNEIVYIPKVYFNAYYPIGHSRDSQLPWLCSHQCICQLQSASHLHKGPLISPPRWFMCFLSPLAPGSMSPTSLADECVHRPDGLPAVLHSCPDASPQQLCSHKKKSCFIPFTKAHGSQSLSH